MNHIKVNNLVQTVPTVTTSYVFDSLSHQAISAQVVWAAATSSWSIQLSGSLDGTNYVAIGSANSVSNNSGNVFTQLRGSYDYRYFKFVATKTSGAFESLSLMIAHQHR